MSRVHGCPSVGSRAGGRLLTAVICAAVVVGGLVPSFASPVPPGVTLVPVSAGRTHGHVDQRLPESGAIRGTVRVAGSGDPVEDTSVTVYRNGHFLPPAVFTDAAGRFTVPGLATGNYRVCAESPTDFSEPYGLAPGCAGGAESVSSRAKAGLVRVTTGQVSFTSIDVPVAGAIGGVARSADGHPLSDVDVYAMQADQPVAEDESGNDGSYRIDGLGAGTYRVCFGTEDADPGPSVTGYTDQCYRHAPWAGLAGRVPREAATVRVRTGAVTGSIDSALLPGGAVSGRVTSSAGKHRPVSFADIVVFAAGRVYDTGEAGAKGYFTVSGLPAGPAKVCASGGTAGSAESSGGCYRSAPFDGHQPGEGAKSVTVRAGRTRPDVDIAAQPLRPGSISGTLTGPGGVALSDATVIAFRHGNEIMTAGTSAKGAYTLPDLPPGAYRVCFDDHDAAATGHSSATGYASGCYRNARWTTGAELPHRAVVVRIRPHQHRRHVDEHVGSAGAVSGTVSLAGGGDRTGPLVQVFDSRGNYLAETWPGRNGSYTVRGLTPSARGYAVCFDAGDANSDPRNGLGYLDQCYRNVPQRGYAASFAAAGSRLPAAPPARVRTG